MVPGILILGGLAGVIFTSLKVIFCLTMLLGIGLFLTRVLVKKSIEATSGLPGLDSFLEELKQQEHKVAQTKYLAKVGTLGEKAHAQAKALTDRYLLINKILDIKFNSGELAYSRYQNAVHAASESLSDNLKLITSTLSSIDVSSTPAEDQKQLVNQLLESNAETLRLLSDLSHSLDQINAGGSLDTSLENSMDELKRLTELAKKYSR